ncbi:MULTISPECIES: PQQ-dependent sugar dehydrogenase [unclassified Methanoculleus]|uniref:PQQ-dependent sugar dehydrogenase n=1 Tax=unclassified Methanoculleus TaxID=2619537 RepID=UPI0025DF6F49|nr:MULTISPECIES: PQQ-dependent sugar dehydrogenase [unclassified Methanoculleus]
MTRRTVIILAAVAVLALLGIAVAVVMPPGGTAGTLPLDTITLPPGFAIDVYAGNVTGARSMTMSPNGTLFVGSRGPGNVYAIPDRDGDGKGDEVIVIANGLDSPNGVALRNGSLYVAEIGRILRYDDIEANLADPPEAAVVSYAFPDDASHGWKFIAFGPDGKLYIPVGVPCNVCDPDDERFGTILRMNPDGTDLEVYARGIRNTVGFDWHPDTGVLWFTDNGRDWLGENVPPDELNRAPESGMHFGFPYCHGRSIPDPEFGAERSCSEFTPPEQELGPHVAALGMRFYTGEQFTREYENRIFIAEHGSWNRAEPIGYRVTMVELENSTPVSYDVFAEGWLQEGDAWGRPVDVEVANDGSLLVSDDRANAVYRITYGGVTSPSG